MKLLDGAALAEFIKERQAKQVRVLRQADGVAPRLAIIRTNPDPVVDRYMKLKQDYGSDIFLDVEVHSIKQSEAPKVIKQLNNDPSVQGIIVQIPLPNPEQTEEILNLVVGSKDVDGLAHETSFDPATPVAIDWLLAGYNIELKGKNILVVGQGRLVGKPLTKMWQASGYKVGTADRNTTNLAEKTRQADIIVTATGRPELITREMVKSDAVIVDAGVATDKNGLVGDVDPKLRELPLITITPEKGGVGPLTVCALFENVIRGARQA